ncbi:uncharacterized protein LOC112183776 [Rosa chinensis]|uniref:uncharacterized protein LOC112183776 n=1 Tax=Rosa chinensis TaxID=74649 RepID=UPI000D095AA8|nr:uncharacterized protein LOC112183776 [Rosa chinensis]
MDVYPRGPSSPPSQDAPKLVMELIDPFTWTWDINVLQRYFTPADIDLILTIPLSRSATLDQQIWHFNKRGFFTTNSAYYVAKDLALGLVLAPKPPVDPLRVVWKKVWSAKVPGKVALHAWRIMGNILPTRIGLNTKGYNGELGCVFCNHPHEDSLHLFVNCPYAKEVWNRAGIPMLGAASTTIQEWLTGVVNRFTKEELCKILMLIWGIWKSRNSQVWEQKGRHASETCFLTLGWYEEFKKHNVSSLVRQARSIRWKAPNPGKVKINVDGAYQVESRRGGVGCVIRDSDGSFVARQARPYTLLTSPFHVELLALRDGLFLAQTLQQDEVIFESDCALLVQAIQSPTYDLSTMHILIGEVRTLLQTHPGFSLTHVNREANVVAHLLASHALRTSDSQMWLVTAPEIIRDVIRNDVIVI